MHDTPLLLLARFAATVGSPARYTMLMVFAVSILQNHFHRTVLRQLAKDAARTVMPFS